MSLYLSAVDGDEGGGADASATEETAAATEAKETKSAEDAKTQERPTKEEPGHVAVPKEQFEAMQQSLSAIENEKALNNIESEIKKEIPDFSIAAVTEYLQNIAKTNPLKAQRLANAPEAWPAIFKAEIRKSEPQNDYVGRHRNEGKEEFDFDKTLAAANDGDSKAFNKLFDNSVSTNYKK